MSVNYRGPFSFDLAFTRCKHISSGIWQVNNRALRFWKSAQNSAATLPHLERVRDRADWEPASPRTLHSSRPKTDWNIDRRTVLGPRPGGTSPELGWSVIAVKPVGSGEVGRDMLQLKFWRKNIKIDAKSHFLTSCQKFIKIARHFCRNRLIF
jgi:hypothetical protein